ncbi:MAG: tetratricopeptide repeat protein [Spirochaetia bacterium]|nr:tetratricopeptide repeat protein [Spirochaetia bacterium]
MAENKKDILKMAMVYTQEGRWDKAIAEYKKLLTLDPTDYNIYNTLGDVYTKKGEDAAAYQCYILASEAYAKQGLADKSLIINKKISRLNPEKLPENDRKNAILIRRTIEAERMLEEGNIDSAIEEYKEILKINQAGFDIYQKLGELYTKKGDNKEALTYYKKIVDVYFKNRLYKKALPIYQKILEIQPDSIVTREKIAEIYEREGNESDAKREYLNLAEYYWKERNVEKTDFFAQKAVDFKSIEAHYFKGVALVMKKEYTEARKELEMLLKFKANHSGALLCLAEIYRDTGAVDDCLATLNKLVKLDPQNTDAQILLGETYRGKGNKKEASAAFMAAVSGLCENKEIDRAIELINRVLMDDQENVELLGKLADIANKANRKKDAADAYIKISDIYKKENMQDKAQEFYKMAQDINPAHQTIVDRARGVAASYGPQQVPPAAKPAPPPAEVKPAGWRPPPSMESIPVIDLGPVPPKTGGLKIQRNTFDFNMPPPPAHPKPAAPPEQPRQQQPEPPSMEPLPDFMSIPIDIPLPQSPQPRKKPDAGAPLPEIDFSAMKRPTEPVKSPPPKQEQEPFFAQPQQTKEDVPALIAMADSLIKTGAFDEGIEMYQKALAIDPDNQGIKTKLNAAYSRYAGIPVAPEKPKEDPAGKVAEEAARKRAEEEASKKRADDEAKKKAEAEAAEKLKKETEDNRKKEAQTALADARKKFEADNAAAAAKKKAEEEASKKMADEEAVKKKADAESADKKKKEEEERTRKEETAKKEQVSMHTEEELVEEPEISDDFATVTTAEIFMKQGLLTEAEKILNRILKKDMENMEARMKLDELKKIMTDLNIEEPKEEKKGDKGGPGKGSKVSYI